MVTTQDPQWVFSTAVLTFNCFCFLFISISYGCIGKQAHYSNKDIGKVNAPNNRALHTKITAIILTDFFCWIPLSVVAFLHLGEVIDATLWYPFFSIIILPINSVINPFLYESTFYKNLATAPFRILTGLYRKWRADRSSQQIQSLKGRMNETEL